MIVLTSWETFYSAVVVSNIDFHNVTDSQDLENILSSYNYKRCHQLLTRPCSGACIDNVYSNITNDILIDTIFEVVVV